MRYALFGEPSTDADGATRWPFTCPDCHAVRGAASSWNWQAPAVLAGLMEPEIRCHVDGPAVTRQFEAEHDGIKCFGPRRGNRPARRSPARDPRQPLATARPWTYTNGNLPDRFDTWCLNCGVRIRVDSRYVTR